MTETAQARVTIVNKWGLHARAAFQLASMAVKFNSRITVEKDGAAADAVKMDELLTLIAGPGDEILITASGPDCVQAAESIAGLVKAGFNED